MRIYEPPLDDIRFVLEHVLELPAQWATMPALADYDADIARQVVQEAGRFTAGILAPLNATGDHQGCTWEHGEVRTPDGFAEAYRAYVEGGWPALACEPAWGGQGLPHAVNAALVEMISASNHAWGMYPGLLHGAYACLLENGSEALKQQFLPRMVSGEWLCTMCLTEPQAGSDLGLIRTHAVALDDGRFTLSGTKIFVSGGEHDLTDNILHLVLARLPDAPPGPKGLSLFLVPKYLPDAIVTTRNGVTCDGIESKMGIKGSATCTMRLENAIGWLVGDANQGLAAMFVMMNAARLHVGLQGVGHADACYRHALRYASERLQGRLPGSSATTSLLTHPAMQQSLLAQRCAAEGARMLAYGAAQQIDIAEHHPDPGIRASAHEALGLLTPVVKAWCSETGFKVASAALQVFGGHGYVAETGAEQSVRDSRISMIYEGTNEIQAIDLVVRKVVADGGRAYSALLDEIAAECESAGFAERGQADILAEHLAVSRARLPDILDLSGRDKLYAYRIADDFLAATALLCLGRWWLRTLKVVRGTPGLDPALVRAKDVTACYFFDFELAQKRFLDHRLHMARTPMTTFDVSQH